MAIIHHKLSIINYKIAVLALFLCLLPVTAMAHENVAAMWTSFSVKKSFGTSEKKPFSLTAYGEYRCKDNFTSTDLWFTRLIASYSFCPYVSAGLSYDFMSVQQGSSVRDGIQLQPWQKHSHRMLADVTGNYAVKKTGLKFSLRERYVLAYSMPATVPGADSLGLYTDFDIAPGLTHVFRSMPTITYAIPRSRFSPYVAAEFYNSLMPGDAFRLQQCHLFVGTGISLADHLSMKLFYLLNTKFPSRKHLHTLGAYFAVSI